jgi:O-antigen/teichoic acid export membrane protein
MAANDALKKLIFPSYNGMSRPAMYWNIPIMALVGLLMCALIFGIAATALLSWVWGLIIAGLFLSALVALRFLCLIDPQYLRRVRFVLRRLKLNFTYGRPLLLTSFNPRWSEFYAERFSQTSIAARSESAGDEVSRARAHGDVAR